MTPQEQAREQAEVMLHFANGGKVQCRQRCLMAPWIGIDQPLWSFSDYEYRKAPEVKPDIVEEKFVDVVPETGKLLITSDRMFCQGLVPVGSIRITIDGETLKLKSVEIV